MGAEIASLWQTAEAAYSSRDTAVAEGVLLDLLAYLIGISRKEPTKGNVMLSCLVDSDAGTVVIPSGTIFAEAGTGLRYATTETITPVLTSCTVASVSTDLTGLEEDDLFVVTIDGVAFTYTVALGDTLIDIYAGISAAINAGSGSTPYWVSVNPVGVPIFYSTTDTPVTVSAYIEPIATGTPSTANIVWTVVGAPVLANAETYDTRTLAPLSTFNSISAISGLISGRNVLASQAGTDIETDVELRLRRQESLSTAGASTLESIVSKVRGLSGVTATAGYENVAITTDSYGRPAKSFEIVVVGGEDEAIAQKIYDFKPAGIETTYGSGGGVAASPVTVAITDENGVDKDIKFSRGVPKYVIMRCEYSLYSEERFLVSGAQGIKDAIYNFGVSGEYTLNKDVIPQRFHGSVYDSVGGIKSLVFRMASSALPTTTPASFTFNTVDSPYDVLDIGIRDYAVFVKSRIVIAQALENTVTTANSSALVTGINAADITKISVGDTVMFNDETAEYVVDSVDSGTQITLASTRPASGQGAGQIMCVKKVTV